MKTISVLIFSAMLVLLGRAESSTKTGDLIAVEVATDHKSEYWHTNRVGANLARVVDELKASRKIEKDVFYVRVTRKTENGQYLMVYYFRGSKASDRKALEKIPIQENTTLYFGGILP